MHANMLKGSFHQFLDKQNYPPLGIMYISSYLKKYGFSCDFRDFQLVTDQDPFFMESFHKIAKCKSKIIGLSCMANLLPFTIMCAKTLKQLNSSSSIVLGGVGPSPVAEEILREFPFVDHVVAGEGEKAMLEIVKGQVKSGVVTCPPIANLDDLPFPDYSLLEEGKYDAAPSVITSRGCFCRCMFCTEPFNFGQKTRLRSIDNVLDEIRQVHKLTGKTLFLFQDDNFILSKERLREFSEAFSNLDFEIKWKSFARVDMVDEEILRLASKSGCVQLRYGVENGSDRVLGELEKGFNIAKAFETVKKSTLHIKSVHVSFMWGFPFETLKDIRDSVAWMRRFEKCGATVLLFQWSPLAGSRLFERYKDELEFHDLNYSNFVLTGHEILSQPSKLIDPRHLEIYNLVREYPNIFPGFYCVNFKNNILKKLNILLLSGFLDRKPLRNPFDR